MSKVKDYYLELEDEDAMDELEAEADDWISSDELRELEELEREANLAEAEKQAEDERRQDVWRYWIALKHLIDAIGRYAGLSKRIIKAERGSETASNVIKHVCHIDNPYQEQECLRLKIWEALYALNAVARRIGVEPMDNREEVIEIVKYLAGHVDTEDNPDRSQNRRDWFRDQSRLEEKGEALSLRELYLARLKLDEKQRR